MPGAALPATRRACARTLLQGGCAPANRDYGVAITGVAGGGTGVLLPVRLAVPRADEPVPAATMTGTVTVSGLVAGRAYKLLRYNSAASVPTRGTAAQWIASAAAVKLDFVAAGATWSTPVSFMSSATVFYRAVAVPVVG